MASDLLSRLDAMARGEHDDLSVAADAAEEIRRLQTDLAATKIIAHAHFVTTTERAVDLTSAQAVVRECAAREAEAVASMFQARRDSAECKEDADGWMIIAHGAREAALAIRKLDLDGRQGAAMMRERDKLLAERDAAWRAVMEEAETILRRKAHDLASAGGKHDALPWIEAANAIRARIEEKAGE